ncbi:SpoIID/LytB domain-containing protein [bacterium]|nr:SpoIID/LytB domain-containing protein [bacterium]
MSALPSDDFQFMHSASFRFRDSVPVIHVLVEKKKSGTFKINAPVQAQCDGMQRVFKGVDITVKEVARARVRYDVSLMEITKDELSDYQSLIKKWESLAREKLFLLTRGGIFSIGSHRINNREYHIALSGGTSKKEAYRKMQQLRRKFPNKSIAIIPLLERPQESLITLTERSSKKKKRVMECHNLVYLSPQTKNIVFGSKTVIPHERIILTSSKKGQLDIVTESDIESLLYRILPGELFLSAPLESLKAQAVAARTDIFMQLGKRHVTEPFHICSSIHCQKILWSQPIIQQKFRDAVDATRGEVLLHKKLYIARAPYSSSAGGHTEDIRFVWFTAKKEYLTGVWDGDKSYPYDLRKERDLRAFLTHGDGEDNISINRRFRWKKEYTDAQFDAFFAKNGLGHIKKFVPLKRGVSGRIYHIKVVGTRKSMEIWGELHLRRKLNSLYSSMFVIDRKPGKWIFTGGGWGHGVGMCQMGAIGMGKKGKDYRTILRHYYPGTESEKLY